MLKNLISITIFWIYKVFSYLYPKKSVIGNVPTWQQPMGLNKRTYSISVVFFPKSKRKLCKTGQIMANSTRLTVWSIIAEGTSCDVIFSRQLKMWYNDARVCRKIGMYKRGPNLAAAPCIVFTYKHNLFMISGLQFNSLFFAFFPVNLKTKLYFLSSLTINCWRSTIKSNREGQIKLGSAHTALGFKWPKHISCLGVFF